MNASREQDYSPLQTLRHRAVPPATEDRARIDALRPEINRTLAQGYSLHQVWQAMRDDDRTALPYEEFHRHLARRGLRRLGILVQGTGFAAIAIGLFGLGFLEPQTAPHALLGYALGGGIPLVAAVALLRL